MASTSEVRLALARKLASLEGRRKVDALTDADDPKALVRSLPAEDLYFTIKEVGLEDCSELVQFASPAQFRTFIDLDCWHRNSLHPRAMLPWLRAADDGEDGLDRKLASLDIEAVELLLREGVAIWDLEEDPDREPAGTPWRSPEGRYQLDFLLEGEDGQALKQVVESYYTRDPLQAIRFLEAVRWELPSELEETALRFRTGRLADLGFPELDQALRLYAYSDPDAPLGGVSPNPSEAPGFFLETLGTRSFLDTALGKLDSEELSRLNRELLYVLNGALVADAVDPGDLDGVRRVLASARGHLSLGLEYAARGDGERARELLLTAPLARLFQVASGLTLRRKFRADRVAASGRAGFPSSHGRCWFDPPLGAAVEGLRRKRPQFTPALEGIDAPRRSFASPRELAVTDAALERAEALASLVAKLGINPAAAEKLARASHGEGFADVTLSEVILHLAIQSRRPAPDPMAPLRPAELAEVLAFALADGSKVSPALAEILQGRLQAPELDARERAVGKELLEYLVNRVARQLPGLAGAPPDAAHLAASPLLTAAG